MLWNSLVKEKKWILNVKSLIVLLQSPYGKHIHLLQILMEDIYFWGLKKIRKRDYLMKDLRFKE